MALSGIKVIEFAGLAPVPFCGMILSDFGASVTRIDRPNVPSLDKLARGKRSVALNCKMTRGRSLALDLCSQSDVIIEPFRPGVMEKLGLGPNVLHARNPMLVYARLTGYGQSGPMSAKAGHDINFLAMSGLLSSLGRAPERPFPPFNLLADFAGGGLLCAFAIVSALLERHKTGMGRVVDLSMTEGSAYVGSWRWKSSAITSLWGKERGHNILDGGAPYYNTYVTKDNKYMAVGALESQFFDNLLKGLGLDSSEVSQHMDPEELQRLLESSFKSRSQAEWERVFSSLDACVTPVLHWSEVDKHEHHIQRQSFFREEESLEPVPAPRFENPTLRYSPPNSPSVGEQTREILKEELNISEEDLQSLHAEGVIQLNNSSEILSKL